MCVLLRGAGVTVSNLEGALHTMGWEWGLEEEKKGVNKKQRKKRVFMAERRRETLCGKRRGRESEGNVFFQVKSAFYISLVFGG